jgi:general secretion pathway protein A
MYRKFFNLREDPFKVNPDPRYLFFTPSAREALAGLAYGIENRKGIVLLTGEVGTGKTTLLNKLLDWLHQRQAATAFIFNTQLSASELLDCLMADFGVLPESRMKAGMLLRLYRWLLERHQVGQLAVLVVDEAQNLSQEALEEIRLLTNLETSSEKLLQIVLSGQPELEEKLRHPQLRQLRQRITLRCRTSQLSVAETRGYVAERLHIAGANGETIFSPEAIESICNYAQGIPRVINVLCEHALINAFVDQQKPIPAGLIDEVAREFELDRVAPTTPLPSSLPVASSWAAEALFQDFARHLHRNGEPASLCVSPEGKQL